MSGARRMQGPLLTAKFAFLALALLLLTHSLRKTRALEREDHSRQDKLDQDIRLAHQRNLERHRLVVALSRGRLPLLEAAARWRDPNRRAPFFWEVFREAHAGASDEERHCRGMIEMASNLLAEEDPCRAQAVRAGLKQELDRLLRLGPLALPVLPPG